jgi:hypothetical protein
MAIIRTFPGSRLEPAECFSNNAADCIRCGNLYDLDDERDDFKEVDGLPDFFDDPAIICWECGSLYCTACGEDVLQPAVFSSRLLGVRDGVTWILGQPCCCTEGCDEIGGEK